MPEQQVVVPVTVQIADAYKLPAQVAGEIVYPPFLGGDRSSTTHRVVVPTSFRVPEQYIRQAISVEVARPGKCPLKTVFQWNSSTAPNRRATVHGIERPCSIGPTQQHVRLAVSVHVPEAYS